ncbi:uncharacterized protein LOC143818406 [Ranitomeya variabilis]|uniref:uncharacterized protein LOC143818406 n=1 Tax=Ranitomeya variabilis TaxID=490064 RepID=UPI00405767FA
MAWRQIYFANPRRLMRFWNSPVFILGTPRDRGYPRCIISTAYQRARRHDQKSLLSSGRRGQETQTRFITDFNNSWKQPPLTDTSAYLDLHLDTCGVTCSPVHDLRILWFSLIVPSNLGLSVSRHLWAYYLLVCDYGLCPY